MKYYCENCGMEFDDSDCFNFSIEVEAPCPVCVTGNALRVIPTHEPVAQWKKRKGRKYPDTAPVYVNRYGDDDDTWFLRKKQNISKAKIVIVATEEGAPPKGWRME